MLHFKSVYAKGSTLQIQIRRGSTVKSLKQLLAEREAPIDDSRANLLKH